MKNLSRVRSRGNWLPSGPKAHAAWLEELKQDVKKTREKRLKADGESPYKHPVIQEFRDLIDNDPIIWMYLTQMIDQVPGYYRINPGGGYLESIDQMLELLDEILGRAPKYSTSELVGFPINAILDWTMGMPAGFAVFRLDKINEMFRKILDVYRTYLDGEESLKVLNDGPEGWMCDDAQEAIKIWDFVHDSKAEHWGFTSWNDFFTRKFKKGKRPVAGKGDNKLIVSACESEVYDIQDNVKKRDWFWVKAQPYSLNDMLGPRGAKYVDSFVGGHVYQAFLSALKYHCWHSPVSGKVVEAFVQPGTYYSEAEAEGVDPAGPNDSQGYITHTATRAIVFIEADDPGIGLMCAIFVGMAEVSSCVILEDLLPKVDPKTGKTIYATVEKGQELGYFQYGGSTHCLIFRPGVIDQFNVKIGDNVKVNEQIAIAN